MTLKTKSEVARLCGVSAMAITNVIKVGEMDTMGEGRNARLDIDAPKNAERMALFQERKAAEPERGKKRGGQTKPKRRSKSKKHTESPTTPPKTTPDDKGTILHERSHLDKLKIIEQTRKIKLETEIKRGEYIKRDLVSKAMGGLYDIDLNVLVAIAPGLAKNIASYSGIDESVTIIGIEKIIHDQMFEVLVHKKGHVNKFLLSIKGEVID